MTARYKRTFKAGSRQQPYMLGSIVRIPEPPYIPKDRLGFIALQYLMIGEPYRRVLHTAGGNTIFARELMKRGQRPEVVGLLSREEYVQAMRLFGNLQRMRADSALYSPVNFDWISSSLEDLLTVPEPTGKKS